MSQETDLVNAIVNKAVKLSTASTTPKTTTAQTGNTIEVLTGDNETMSPDGRKYFILGASKLGGEDVLA